MYMKTLLIVCMVSLLLGLANLPIGYYTFLRIIVTIGCISVIMEDTTFSLNNWVIIFIVIGILFNPIFPVFLNKKSLWMLIDLVAAIIFGIKAFSNKKNS